MNTKRVVESLSDYYREPDVRARLLQFMGDSDLESVTAEFITGDDENADVGHYPIPPDQIWNCLKRKQEVGRSLWDRQSLIVDLDVEYVNFDQPALPFAQPKACYDLQKPVVLALEHWLLRFGIAPLHWLSGQGHHFAWKIQPDSDSFKRLTKLGQLTDSLRHRYQHPAAPNGNCVGLELGAAFSGLGMVMEYVAHEIRQACQSETEIPIVLSAIEAGPVRKSDVPQREVIALDLSEYGDPLDTRGIRMPFSVYLKPSQKRYQLGDPFVDALPLIFPIPLSKIDTDAAVDMMRVPEKVVDLASRASTAIPDFSVQMSQLIDIYCDSPLARFHKDFYEDDHDSPNRWPETYDQTRLDELPACASQPLKFPNDLLLKPSVIQHLVRTLMSHGWKPRHIAGLIRSKYERDYGWGERWYRYDAASHADFFVRMFGGAIVTGQDPLIDFNCVSTQEKHFCPVKHCGNNLVHLRDRLAQQVTQQHYLGEHHE